MTRRSIWTVPSLSLLYNILLTFHQNVTYLGVWKDKKLKTLLLVYRCFWFGNAIAESKCDPSLELAQTHAATSNNK